MAAVFTLGQPIVAPGFAILQSRTSTPGKPTLLPLGGIVDGFLSEEHKVRLSKTSYPVERTGLPLTDHAVIEPRTLKLTGWVSDLLPTTDRGDPSATRGLVAWRQVYELMQTREPLTVVTTLGTYTDMLITSATAPVDRTTGRALRFDLELEEVLFRGLEPALGRVVVGPAQDRVGNVDKGRVQAPSTADMETILAKIRLEISAGLPAFPSPRAAISQGLPEEDPSFWRRTLTAMGNAAILTSPYIRY